MELCLRGIQTLKRVPAFDTTGLDDTVGLIRRRAHACCKKEYANVEFEPIPPSEWPEQGSVRREVYPWNDREAERFSDASLRIMNDKMHEVAPKLAVRVTDLPILHLNQGELDPR